MAKLSFRADIKASFDQMLLELPEVTVGIVFGLPCYKVRGTVFATLYGDGVGIKLPADRVAELLKSLSLSLSNPWGVTEARNLYRLITVPPKIIFKIRRYLRNPCVILYLLLRNQV